MEKNKKGLIYWIVAAVLFIAFWPIGCVLLYLGCRVTYGKLRTNGVTLILVAIFCYITTLAGISVTFEDLSTDLAINLFVDAMFLTGGILSTVFATKSLKKYKHCKETVEGIGARVKVSVDKLAEETGETIDRTKKNIYEVIKYKMIDGYINEDDELIIRFNGTYDTDDNVLNNDIENKKEIVNIQCRNCGANNKFVTGKENRCEFCGSLLELNGSLIK